MRIALLDKREWARGTPLEAFAEWGESQGHSIEWCNPVHFSGTLESDVIATLGLYDNRWLISETLQAQGRQVLIFDAGFFGRDRFYRVCLNRPEWLFPTGCPSDRFDSLGLAPSDERKEDGYVLIADQSSATDELVFLRKELNSYPAQAMLALRKATKRNIVLRTHPLMPSAVTVTMGLHDGKSVPLAESLAGAYAVCSHSSNVANDAMLRGIHVFTGAPTQMNGLANTDLATIESPRTVGAAERAAYLARLAYTQWTIDEIRTGAMWSAYQAILFEQKLAAYREVTNGD